MAIVAQFNHETGDLSEYDVSATDGGDLSVTAAAALAGTSRGLAFLIDDTYMLYANKVLAANDTSGVVRVRVYMDPNGMTITEGRHFGALYIVSGDGTTIILGLYWGRNAGGANHAIQCSCQDDAGLTRYAYAGQGCDITDEPHLVEAMARRATNATSSDGSLTLWIDGTQVGSNTNVDNYDAFVHFRYIGPAARNVPSTGTYGTFYIDEIVVNDDGSEIGPVASSGSTAARFMHYARLRR